MNISQLLKKTFRKDDKEVSFFTNNYYQLHNIKRLSHLDSLHLDLDSRNVLEIGAGIGDHTYYYLLKNCNVISTDGRENLVSYIKKRFGVPVMKLDAEKEMNKLDKFGKFDIIHCYGVLYHLSDPEEFLSNLKGRSTMLLLETCVSHDMREDDPYIVFENKENPTQSLSGSGCRPTRQWIFQQLKKNFDFVYMPFTQPDHIEFPLNWTAAIEDRKKLIRAIFIASEKEIQNANLTDSIPRIYTSAARRDQSRKDLLSSTGL